MCQKNYGERIGFTGERTFPPNPLRDWGREFREGAGALTKKPLAPSPYQSPSHMVAQAQFQGVGIEVILFLEVGLAVLAHIVVDEG
jgi:hypothetical protein